MLVRSVKSDFRKDDVTQKERDEESKHVFFQESGGKIKRPTNSAFVNSEIQ